MPTTRFYPRQIFQGLDTALPDIARFLINDHPTYTGPGWTIVEAQSGGNREIPSDPTDLDSLSSATGWPSGSISTNDWIVLESANANNSNHFQLYMEYHATNDILFKVIPLQDFVSGSVAASPPTLPATSFGEGSSLTTFSKASAGIVYNVIADEGMMILLTDNLDLDGCDWIYVGEIDPAYPASDDRCYVLHDTESHVQWADSSVETYWNRLSPLDDSTILVEGSDAQLYTPDVGTKITEDAVSLGRFSNQINIYPVGLWFNDTGHAHFSGWLRNVYSIHARAVGERGTLNNRQFMFRNNSGHLVGALVFPWDGSTEY